MEAMDAKTETKIPKEGEFDQGRFWYSRRGNVITIGLTSLAIDSLGDLETIELPEEGDHFDAGDDIATVDGTRGSYGVSLPMKGVVLEVNAVASDPGAVAEDPLEEGWLLKYQVDDLAPLTEL
jgi:glycine cleavage system H protein